MPGPFHLSRTGVAVLDARGKVERRLKSRAKARGYLAARNNAWRKSKGKPGFLPARSRKRKR